MINRSCRLPNTSRGTSHVLTLSGQLTLDDGDLAFGRYVDEMIDAGRDRIVVDLSGVSYIDSAGVGMLVAESKRVAQHGGADASRAPHGARSYHLLAMLKLSSSSRSDDDVEAAVRSYAWRPR